MNIQRASRWLGALGVVTALMAGSTTPAGAQAAGAGVVTGTVAITPGVDLSPNNNTFTFTGFVIAGGIEVETIPWAGTVTVPVVTGSANGETTISGSGTVNGFAASGTTNVANVETKTLGVTVRSGTFVRVGGVVVVTLDAHLTIACTGVISCAVGSDATVTVVAVFVPTTGNGLGRNPQNPPGPIPGGDAVTAAQFAGIFAAN